jgi:hypothetical protein
VRRFLSSFLTNRRGMRQKESGVRRATINLSSGEFSKSTLSCLPTGFDCRLSIFLETRLPKCSRKIREGSGTCKEPNNCSLASVSFHVYDLYLREWRKEIGMMIHLHLHATHAASRAAKETRNTTATCSSRFSNATDVTNDWRIRRILLQRRHAGVHLDPYDPD